MEPRARSFYLLSAFFALFVMFLYGTTLTIGILSFQGEGGGLTFPMRGVSMYWFYDLFEQQAVGDIWGSFRRCFPLLAGHVLSLSLFPINYICVYLRLFGY